MHPALEQLLYDYVKERPECVEQMVKEATAQYVERLLEERREAIETGISKRLVQSVKDAATREYLDLFLASFDKDRSVKPVQDLARDEARKQVANMMRLWQEELTNMQRELKRLRELLQSDDADWWKSEGEEG